MKLIIWDFDGTLADTRPVIEAGMEHTLETLGLDPALKEEWLKCVGLPVEEGIQRTFGHLGVRLEQVVAAYRGFKHAEHEHLIKGFDGITELLAELRGRGLPMAIASSKRGEPLRRQLKVLGWEGFFDPLVTPDEVRVGKPDPESLRLCLAAHGVGPEEAVMVGDTPYDLDMAQRAGVPSVAVGHGFSSQAEMAAYGPRAYAPDTAALRDILLAWSEP
ncbi:MAG: HAD family hydrolase [Holophaga sp.]|jgi:HAD superfamily hydrolase (TIGR01509 family)